MRRRIKERVTMDKYKGKECENCKERIRPSNYERHLQRCKRGKRISPTVQGKYRGICDECKQEYKSLREHKRRGCNGKIKGKRSFRMCINCMWSISTNNYNRHFNACKEKHKVKRRRNGLNNKKEEKDEQEKC
jgi:hypothetical protein